MKLSNNTIFITGGSSGIGLEMAHALTQKGNQVIICGRSTEKLEKAAQTIPGLKILQCDLSKSKERKQLVNRVMKKHPECNVLINNAAVVHKTDFFSDQDMIEKANLEIETNFTAPVELTKLFSPHLEKNPGSAIIYITTGLVYSPKAAYPIYCATKSALHSFIKTLRWQIKDIPISIYEVLMPAVDTPFHRGNPPQIAISPNKAVKEMMDKLEKDQKEIKIGPVGVLHYLSRIAPGFTMKKVNSF